MNSSVWNVWKIDMTEKKLRSQEFELISIIDLADSSFFFEFIVVVLNLDELKSVDVLSIRILEPALLDHDFPDSPHVYVNFSLYVLEWLPVVFPEEGVWGKDRKHPELRDTQRRRTHHEEEESARSHRVDVGVCATRLVAQKVRLDILQGSKSSFPELN